MEARRQKGGEGGERNSAGRSEGASWRRLGYKKERLHCIAGFQTSGTGPKYDRHFTARPSAHSHMRAVPKVSGHFYTLLPLEV